MDGAKKLADTISEMKGFYVKAAQIIASRGTFPCVKSFDANLRG
jgi:predicted unusual protein kinase regulating ubiquinone biosynthesis (AarF/ABC1/UbiB family)